MIGEKASVNDDSRLPTSSGVDYMGAFESRVDSSETIDLLKGLVGIKSVNPFLIHGAPVEAEIAEHVGGVHEGHRHGVVG